MRKLLDKKQKIDLFLKESEMKRIESIKNNLQRTGYDVTMSSVIRKIVVNYLDGKSND